MQSFSKTNENCRMRRNKHTQNSSVTLSVLLSFPPPHTTCLNMIAKIMEHIAFLDIDKNIQQNSVIFLLMNSFIDPNFKNIRI